MTAPYPFTLNYQNASLKDLPFIVEVYNSTIANRMVTADTEAASIESKLTWFYQHNPETRPLWVVDNALGEMVGWVSYQSFYGRPAYDGTAEISIYLHPDFRGQGYGKQIVQHAIGYAPELRIHTLLAFIFAHNAPSIELFAKNGFENWGYFPDVAILDGISRSLVIMGLKTGGAIPTGTVQKP